MEYISGKMPILLHMAPCFLHLQSIMTMMAMMNSTNPPAIFIRMMFLQKKHCGK